MLKTMWAVVRDGKNQVAEKADLPEGARVLVTVLPPRTKAPSGAQPASRNLPRCGRTPRTTSMANFSKNDVILVHYPFTDHSASKVRPAVVVHAPRLCNETRCAGIAKGVVRPSGETSTI